MPQIPSTISEQISKVKELEISYRVLHPTVNIESTVYNREINVPFSSIINKYRHYLNSIVSRIDLSPKEQEKYIYKPKMLSEDLYGTTELWDSILILNDCVSVTDFKPVNVFVYDPRQFKSFINEIMLLEESIGSIVF
jgi:hypothetical protein